MRASSSRLEACLMSSLYIEACLLVYCLIPLEGAVGAYWTKLLLITRANKLPSSRLTYYGSGSTWSGVLPSRVTRCHDRAGVRPLSVTRGKPRLRLRRCAETQEPDSHWQLGDSQGSVSVPSDPSMIDNIRNGIRRQGVRWRNQW